jgi:hypothetical protein
VLQSICTPRINPLRCDLLPPPSRPTPPATHHDQGIRHSEADDVGIISIRHAVTHHHHRHVLLRVQLGGGGVGQAVEPRAATLHSKVAQRPGGWRWRQACQRRNYQSSG